MVLVAPGPPAAIAAGIVIVFAIGALLLTVGADETDDDDDDNCGDCVTDAEAEMLVFVGAATGTVAGIGVTVMDDTGAGAACVGGTLVCADTTVWVMVAAGGTTEAGDTIVAGRFAAGCRCT